MHGKNRVWLIAGAISAVAVFAGNFGCTPTGAVSAAGSAPVGPSAPPTVKIDFAAPEKFTDFRLNDRGFERSSTLFSQNITSALLPVMARRFPGHTLELQYTNIDLANRRSSGPELVRAVRPARLEFNYVLQNPSGQTVARGSRTLVDSAPTPPSRSRLHPAQTEANMMQRWLRSLRVPT